MLCNYHKEFIINSFNYTLFLCLLLLCPLTAHAVSPQLEVELNTALKNKGADYQPRTEHFNSDGSPKYTNRLILEQSPYLIQHAHNPVNWYAWGKEAFAAAKRENKPVFLSIGYSTCHWCHVMERESFDNETIAAYLNKHFIAIKVDRERRPDVDKIYMTALMLVQGSGGWPMSSFLTPEGKPFLSGTYYPPEQFMPILQRSAQLWQDKESKLRELAERISSAVQSRQHSLELAEHIGKERVQIAVISLLNRFDELQGGFSSAPKFPHESYLFLLLDMVIREQDEEVLQALELTMSLMAQGGIYDQVGGGFHRYAIDNEWLIPHFEKMLYNQAHLANTYLQLYQITQNKAYKRVVTQTLDYVLGDMQTDKQAFFSASDADSEGAEGRYFLWTIEELEQSLTPAQAKLAIAVYGVSKAGNFPESDATILNMSGSLADFARLNKLDSEQLYKDIDSIREALYQKRQLRIAPAIDAKVVTAWNAMMITALAKAGKVLNKEQYTMAAENAAEFLWQTHYKAASDKPVLWRASLNGKPSIAATQLDYAYLAQAYVVLFDITKDKKWLTRSKLLVADMIRLFWDKQDGSFFMTALAAENEQEVPLFDRPRDIYDGAIPSGNALALEVLSQLYYRTGNDYYHAKAMAMIASLSSIIKTNPVSFAYFLMAVNQFNFGELGDIQYGAKGHIRLEKKQGSQKNNTINAEISITIDKGWHINSRYPKDKELIASSINIAEQAAGQWKITKAEYPSGEELKLKLNESPLSLYQGTVTIKLTLESIAEQSIKTIPLEVSYQSCSDSLCLAPETKTFYIFTE